MNLADIRTHLDYHYWARDRALDAAEPLTPEQWTRDMGSSFRSVRDTLVHICAAERNWLLRLQGGSPTEMLSPDAYVDVATLRPEWIEYEANMRAVVEAAGDEGLGRVYDYRMMNGQAASSTLQQIVLHVVNHASYHRGQLTTLLRQLGVAPARSMDLIGFYRRR